MATVPPAPSGGRERDHLGDHGAGHPVRVVPVEGADQRNRFHGPPQAAIVGAPARHRRSGPGPAGAHDLWWTHLAGRGLRSDGRRHRRRHHRRRHCRHVAWRRRLGPDVAHRPLSVAADVAAAAAGDLFLPRFPQGAVRAGGRRLHPDRHRHRRLALDAGGKARARAVSLAAREGVRRGGACAGRQQDAPGRAPHPAQRAGPGDRGRHHRRRRRHHRRVRPCRSWGWASRPTSRPGAAFCTTPRTISTSLRIGRCSPAPPSFSPCSPSTSSATACAMRSIRAG